MEPPRILIVEDEIIIATDIQYSLESLGYVVLDTAASGAEAIQIAAAARPDLVLMDIKLEGAMDGVDAAEQIRVQFDIPVIYLTANVDDHTLQRAKITEPYGYILKPFEERELHTNIEIALYKHKIESKLRKVERWFAAMLKSVGDAVIATDTDGTVTFINLVAELLTGWTHGDAIGQNVRDVVRILNGATRAPLESPVAQVLREGLVVGLDDPAILIARDGTELAIDKSAAPIRDDHTTIIGVVLVFRDITERRLAEEQRLALERKLLETQKLESLGVLAGGIAHDFNNLLMAILGNVGLALLDIAPGAPARESLEKIEIATQRAADLTRQMLAYAGKGRFVVQRLDLNTLVTEMTELLNASISRAVLVRYQLAARLPAIEADVAQIQQVVMNLIVNAAEAIGDGSGVITVTTGVRQVDRALLARAYFAPDLPEEEYVCLEVADTGHGMDAATQAKIFDPFFTTKFTGRGLGLAAVLGIVRSHRGMIALHSAPGRGTTFTVLLPASANTIEGPLGVQPAPAAWLGHGTALVIDDEESVRGVTARILGRLGFTVLMAPDGRAGVATFEAHADVIRCVLLDMTMPHMSGPATFRAIRRIRPAVPIVLMSGYTEQEAARQFADDRAVGFLQKPFNPTDLGTKLQQVFGESAHT